MTIRARFEDQRGRTVELTAERWGHIAERHSDIRALGDAVERAVQRPDYWTRGRNANEEWFYLKTDAPSAWLKVVVAYAEGRGHVVTAFARRSIP
jgi:hypothetical protein